MTDTGAAGGQPPKKTDPPGGVVQKGFNLLRDHWRVAAVTILVPVLASSETAFKSIIDSWTSSCNIVIDVADEPVTQEKARAFPIEVFVAGKAPPKAKLVLTANEFLFSELRLSRKPGSPNGALHPKSGESEKNSDGARSIVFPIEPLSSVYSYYFLGVLTESDRASPVQKKDFAAFVQIDTGDVATAPAVCKVEQASMWNLTVGRNNWLRFALVVLFVIVLGSVISILKAPRKPQP